MDLILGPWSPSEIQSPGRVRGQVGEGRVSDSEEEEEEEEEAAGGGEEAARKAAIGAAVQDALVESAAPRSAGPHPFC